MNDFLVVENLGFTNSLLVSKVHQISFTEKTILMLCKSFEMPQQIVKLACRHYKLERSNLLPLFSVQKTKQTFFWIPIPWKSILAYDDCWKYSSVKNGSARQDLV